MEQKIIENVSVTQMSAEGLGIGKVDGKVYFIKNAIPGDIVHISVSRSKKNFAEASILEIITPSPFRQSAVCSHFGVCGGCKWQHIQYEAQLKFKQTNVTDAFERIGKVSAKESLPIAGSESVFQYRNKLEYAFTDRKWLTIPEIESGESFDRRGVGFHVPGSFLTVLDVEKCELQAEPTNQIRIALKNFAIEHEFSFFDLKKQSGFLRNMIVRITSLNEIMVVIIFGNYHKENIEKCLAFLIDKFPQISSLQYAINPKKNDTIYDLEVVLFKGKKYITEVLGGYQFKIGAKSFFQTNSRQAEKLYSIVKDFAGASKEDVIYDLYTGVGSIALYMSATCQKVIGIEQVEDAIKDANENAAFNQINNCTFLSGDVRMVLKTDFIEKYGKADIVITDPPRAGMHEDVINTLLALEPAKIVYVSCNPSTQARDLQLLSTKYSIGKIQPVDMFPQTAHIENVALLIKQN